MTIVTRQSSPNTGTECPGDCTNNTNSSTNSSCSNSSNEDKKTSTTANRTRRKMKIRTGTKRNRNNNSIQNRFGNLGVTKSVMCETTNLTPANKKSSSAAVSASTSTDTSSSTPTIDLTIHPFEIFVILEDEVEGVKKSVKKISKVKLKNGNGPQKEDLVACRKSRRLLNRIGRYDRLKHAGIARENEFGRTVELINPMEPIDYDCPLTKVLFLNSLDLKSNFLKTSPVRSLKQLCVQELIRQRTSKFEKNELYFPAVPEKRIRYSTEDELIDLEPISIIQTMVTDESDWNLIVNITELNPDGTPVKDEAENNNKIGGADDDDEGYCNFFDYMNSVVNNLPAPVKEFESHLDCAKKILRNEGTELSIIGPPGSVSTEIQDLIDESNMKRQRKDDDDDGPWYNWEIHVLSLLEEFMTPSPNPNDNAQDNEDSTAVPMMSMPIENIFCNPGPSSVSAESSSGVISLKMI